MFLSLSTLEVICGQWKGMTNYRILLELNNYRFDSWNRISKLALLVSTTSLALELFDEWNQEISGEYLREHFCIDFWIHFASPLSLLFLDQCLHDAANR